MQQARPKILACNQIAQLAVNLMFLLLQNVSVLEVPTRVSISFAMEIYPSTSPSMCERERETLLPHQIPYLSQSVFVVQVNKKPDHKEKEKHRRWDSEIFFFFRRCQMKIMGMTLISPATSSPLSTEHSNSISSSSTNSRINRT